MGYPDWEGNKSKVYLTPEWAAFEATDVNLTVMAANIGWSLAVQGNYLVPAGRIFYLCGVGFSIEAFLQAQADNNQIGRLYLADTTAPAFLVFLGGNGGGGLVFPKPPVVPGNHNFRYELFNQANHNCNLFISIWGYLV